MRLPHVLLRDHYITLHEASESHHPAVADNALVDTATNAVLDIHVTTTWKHDTQIAPQVVKRNTASIAVLTGDKGYDNQKPRWLARNHGGAEPRRSTRGK
jgi:hypothetical protein